MLWNLSMTEAIKRPFKMCVRGFQTYVTIGGRRRKCFGWVYSQLIKIVPLGWRNFKGFFFSIFNWISKVIRGWIGFTLLCHLIASENHPHPDAQPKPIVTWSFAFSFASDSFGCVNSHWLLALFPLFKLAVVITLRNSTYSGWLVLYILP